MRSYVPQFLRWSDELFGRPSCSSLKLVKYFFLFPLVPLLHALHDAWFLFLMTFLGSLSPSLPSCLSSLTLCSSRAPSRPHPQRSRHVAGGPQTRAEAPWHDGRLQAARRAPARVLREDCKRDFKLYVDCMDCFSHYCCNKPQITSGFKVSRCISDVIGG